MASDPISVWLRGSDANRYRIAAPFLIGDNTKRFLLSIRNNAYCQYTILSFLNIQSSLLPMLSPHLS